MHGIILYYLTCRNIVKSVVLEFASHHHHHVSHFYVSTHWFSGHR